MIDAWARLSTWTCAASNAPSTTNGRRGSNSRRPRSPLSSATPSCDRRLATSIWLEAAQVEVPFTERAAARGQELVALGFGTLDALHTAFAEAAGARWLVTTDDRLVALGQRHGAALSTQVANPVRLLEILKEGDA